MEHLEYQIVISAPAEKVWEIMLQEQTYRQRVAKSWPNSLYKGKWEKGEKVRFIGPDGRSTLVELDDVKPYERIFARHIAVLTPGGGEDKTSNVAKGWIGTTEEYRFAEREGQTALTVLIGTNAEWKDV